jgi:glyceraldehyde 3-phosphate dehydrogenase
MSVRVGINGFGRIGRSFLRAVHASGADVEIVAVNDLGDARTMAHLLRFDSIYGPFADDVAVHNGSMRVGGHELAFLSEPDPAQLPWRDLGVEVALESTGHFRKRDELKAHLDAGAERVLVSAPVKGPDATIVLGVNDDAYDPERHRIVSNASCTTNCVAPVAKVLNDAFGIESGFMTTIHAYTNDQRMLDLPHKDLRRARAAAINLIPTSTGAAKAIGLVIPELDGKLDGVAVRAPVADGSLVDLTVHLRREVSAEQVNEAFAAAADARELEGILRYSDDPLVSTDVIGSSYSAVFDSQLTMAKGREAKVFAWYDNEWGYSCRLVDLAQRLAGREPVPAGSRAATHSG